MITKHLYILLLVVAFFTACKNSGKHDGAEKKQKIYTCPMHPQIIKNVPSTCPVCGMDLVEKRDEGAAIQNDTLMILLKPANEFVVSQIKTVRPLQKEIPVNVDASGTIGYDTRELNVVSAWVSGRIEKLYVKYRYQPVSKGQKLMDIYSEELVTEQENYIYLLNNDAGNLSLIKAAESRLSLLGFSSEQIKEIRRMKKPFQSVTIYSPYAGHLHALAGSKNVKDMSSSQGMQEPSSQELTVKEGMYVERGQSIFNIYNSSEVWASLTIYPEGIGLVKTGQKVVLFLNAEDDVKLEARIDFIEPIIAGEQTTMRARVYLNNVNNELKIGTIVKAKIEAGVKKGNFIPSTAIVSLGNRDIVFVKEKAIFKSRHVLTGIKTDQYTEIISGISGEESIAENAQLLMDSESFIKATDHE